MRHYQLGRGKWVFIDWMGIEPGYGTAWGGAVTDGFCVPEGVELRVHRPTVAWTPVIPPDRPWENIRIASYATFMEDEGRFRCWYLTAWGENGRETGGALAYAESDDGVTWVKPSLGLCDFNGSTANNLLNIYVDHVFKDPSAPPAERYKAVGCSWAAEHRGMTGAVSPDGLHWTYCDELILPGNNADTQNIVLFDEPTGKYVLYTRQRDGVMQRRGINRSESDDFRHFPPSEPIYEASPLDPPDWDFYSNGYSRWPGAVDAHVMRLTLYQHTRDTVNIHLATSRDGKAWHRPLGRAPWIDGEEAYPRRYAQLYAGAGILPTRPGEWSSYFGAHHCGHNETELPSAAGDGALLRAVSREDGFMSLSSDGHGHIWTIPFVLDTETIRVNLRTRHSGYLRAELQAAGTGDTGTAVTVGKPLPGYTLAESRPITGNHLAAPLAWTNGDNLSALRGQSVRLRLELYKADVFALKF